MEEIIKITEKTGLGQVVSARELYEFLEVRTDFTDWCKRMFEYGFEEGVDFSPILGKSTGGRPSRDYALTLDTAKEISMIQRSDKGRQARRYFIECERIVRANNLSSGIFTIQDGRIFTTSKRIAKVANLPLKSINKSISDWVDKYCDMLLEGDKIYFNKYRLVPKSKSIGVIGKMLCSNVFVTKDTESADRVYHLSDVAILRFLERETNVSQLRNLLEIFKDQASIKELEISRIIHANNALPEGSNEQSSLDFFFAQRYGLFSNFEYAYKCWKAFVKENDIIDKWTKSEVRSIYKLHGNR